MELLANEMLRRVRSGKLTVGFGVHTLRGAVAPLLATADYHWLFIDSEYGAISTSEISQICLAALGCDIVPLMPVCRNALDEALAPSTMAPSASSCRTSTLQRKRAASYMLSSSILSGGRRAGGPSAQIGYRPPHALETCRNHAHPDD